MIKPYYETPLGKLYHGDCLEIMPELEPVDLVVTSPPYDNLRDYGGYVFDFERIAENLYLKVAPGGVVVWVVGDATINGSETGTSFKQALYFKEIGFNLHDTMIWNKNGFSAVGSLSVRYAPVFEYMFILTNGNLKTFNPIKDKPNKWAGDTRKHTMNRQKDGTTTPSKGYVLGEFGQRYNIWDIYAQRQWGGNNHPAPFPQPLAHDHIISWSNEGDMVADIMCGSGTTLKMAEKLNRRWIGIEIEEKYCEIAAKRIEQERKQLKLF